ncbi:leucine-rich repeat domain-containing protein [bacterium]|nr:leucine-rich repeat domain-containing protein [bacterium]
MRPYPLTVQTILLLAGIALALGGCSRNSAGNDDVATDDGTAPAVVQDLAVYAFTDSSVTLTWTASGDDSTIGTAARYELRMARSTIHWGSFDSAQLISGLADPKPAGQQERFEVTGLHEDSTYFFALRVFDEKDNYNGVSNCVHATCINDFVVTIPDAGLLAAIRARLSKPAGDILKSDLLGIEDLLATDLMIADLTGLEYCTNLKMLNIINNDVSGLAPLTGLRNLEQLHAGQNDIVDIAPLSNLTNVTWLRLNENRIADISYIANLTGLTQLDLQGNAVVDVAPLETLVNLVDLQLTANRIRDIAPLVSNSGLGSGDVISLHLNPLLHESIFTHIPALRSRGVTVNWMENTVPPGAIVDLAVDTVTASAVTLTWTAPGEDFYEGIAYRYDVRYGTVRAEVENWTGGDVAAGPTPDTSGTGESLLIDGLLEDSTYYFAVRTQDNSENWSGISNIVWARPFSDEVVGFPDVALESAIREAIGKPTGDIYRSDLTSLDTLIADGQGISSLVGLENCANLIILHLIDNDVTALDPISGLLSLVDLNLQGNNVTDISPLVGLANLLYLQLTGNPIDDLEPLSSLTQLRLLAISLVGADSIGSLSSLGSLQYLFMTGNNIDDLTPLSGLTELVTLFAGYNAVEDLAPLQGLTQLITLDLRYNQIVDIQPLVNNIGLGAGDQLNLTSNPLSTTSIDIHIPALQTRGVSVTF